MPPENLPAAAVDNLPFLTIGEAAALLRARQVSPVELAQVVLDRIDRLDAHLHAYITVTRGWALELARAAEQEITAGHYRGPLHGVPIGLKDLYDTAGVLTTAGSKVLADNVPAAHAAAVARLLEAGAVVVGKHNMHEFARGFTNVNPHFGTAQNPWRLGHIAGGSSGGTAAALAAGLCLGGLGSDTAGSIRVPAAFCGITGLKPTYGRVSVRGVIPLSWTLDHAGPMARSAADCALLLNAVAGYDPDDDLSMAVPTDDYTADLGAGIRGLRLGIIQDFMEDPGLAPDVARAVQEAIELLGNTDAILADVRLPDLEPIRDAGGTILSAEAAAYHAAWIERRPEGYGPDLRARIRSAPPPLAVPLVDALRLRMASIRRYDRLMEAFDALVGPTTPITAPPEDDLPSPSPYGRFTLPFDVTGLPALSVPCGFDRRGLPIGLMLVGRRWDERTVLRIGAAYQRATDWHRRRPAVG